MRVNARAQHGGFTLVELLIVVSVVALLASILVPSLTRAKVLAAEVKCGSNLHQVGNAVRTYVSMHRLAMPWLFDNASGDYAWESGHGRQPGCPPRALTVDPNDPTRGHNILHDGQAFFCPLAPITYEEHYERTPPSNNWVTFWGTFDWHWRKRLAEQDELAPTKHSNAIKWCNPASRDLLMIDTQQKVFRDHGYPVAGGEHYNVLMLDSSVFLLTRDPDERLVWLWGQERRPY